MNEEIVYIYNVTHALTEAQLQTTLNDAMSLMRLLPGEVEVIAPSSIKNVDAFLRELGNIFCTKPLQVVFRTASGCFSFRVEQGSFVEKIFLTGAIFNKFSALIEDYCDQLQKQFGEYGFIRSYREFLQNNESVMSRRPFNSKAELDALPKMKNDQGELVIDCQKLPGYNHYFRGLLFTSCWVMYMSQSYTDFLPKNIFLNAQQVEAIAYFATSPQKTIKTKLFKNIFNWAHPANLIFQKMYQEQLGIYQLGSNNGVGVLVEPMTEYQFIKGSMQSIQYFNVFRQPTYKSQASYFLSRELDYASRKESVVEKKGVLNIRAYFPFVNEKSQQLLAYRVLFPERTLDAGASAYHYYIDQFLKIEVLEEDYQNYLPVLVFYVPKKALKTLPLKQLEEKFPEVKVKPVRVLLRQQPTLTFDLTKDEQKLRIVFADQSQLVASSLGEKKLV